MKKRLLALLAVLVMVLGLVACGAAEEGSADDKEAAGIPVYTFDGTFNSETPNQFRNLYLVDDDTYILEIEVLNSQDASQHTVEFVMRGSYTKDGDQVTLVPGYGNGYAMNGSQAVPATVTPENTGMLDVMLGTNGIYTFKLLENGTYEPVVEE